MRTLLSIFLFLLPLTLFASPQVAPGQQIQDIHVERLIVQGMTKSFLGYHDEAIVLFKKALDISPTSSAVNAAIAESYAAMEEFSTAIYHATQARDFSPENLHYHQQLADLYVVTDNLTSAESIYRGMLNQFPDDTNILEELAELQFSSAQYDKALETYEQLVSQIGPQQHISYRLLQIHYQRNDLSGMENVLLDLQTQNPNSLTVKRNLADLYAQSDRQDQAILILEEAIALDSTDVETIVPLAKLYEEKDQEFKADELWKRAMDASGTPGDAYNRASHLYARAGQHIETLEVVVKLLEYAIDQDPTFTEALILLGTIRFEANLFEEAGELLYKAVETNPRNPEVWLQAAAAYLRVDEPKRAADIADEALLLFPGQTSLLRVAAYGYMDSYQNRRAINHFNEFYDLLRDDDSQQRELSEILSALGLLHARTKNYEASDSSYVAALKISPDNAIVLNNLAYSLAERNASLEQALKYAEKAVGIENDNPSFLDTLGWIYFKMGNTKQAETWVKKAIDAGASSAITFEHLGDIQVQLGKAKAAVDSWTKSLELNPDNPLLIEKIKNNE